MKTVAIMQPYFFPYIGYFQLIAAADTFVVYDNIKYTKKGWINRNRILQDGKDAIFSLPLKSGSDALDVRERELATDFDPEKLLDRIHGHYRRAPFFENTFPLISRCLHHEDRNLFGFLLHSLRNICEHLGIATKIEISSGIHIDHQLKSQEKVLALCEALGATRYVNAIGGMTLYAKDDFGSRGIELKFIKSHPFEYQQFNAPFVPWLSIIDVLMFNSTAKTLAYITDNFDLVSNDE